MKPVKQGKNGIIWVLIYTKAKQEIKANENLQKQGFKTFLPLIAPTNEDGEFKSFVPLFPRYVFAQINLGLENWHPIKNSYGVSKIIMFGNEFTSIPFSIIEFMQTKLDTEGVYKESVSKVEYKKGDLLTIKDGRFAGIEAVFLARKSKDRVRLLLKFLNTTVNAEIKKSDIGWKEVIKEFKL